jgi:hypothetical protein
MASINNHFPHLLTSLCFCLLVFFPLIAYASDPIFTIEDVKVDVTAENAIAAREKAFNQAQVKAFEELTTRMIPDADLSTTQTPAPNIISTMIKDFELTNEQLSSVRYVGTYTFRFKDRDVRRYFSQKGNAITDVSSNTLLVLPFMRKGANTILWTPGNQWMQAWNRVPSLNGLVPMEVPLGDIADVRDIGDSQALSYDPDKLERLLTRYNAQEAVIAIANPDAALVQLTHPNAVAQGRVELEIYRTDRRFPELVQQVNVASDGVLTTSQLYDRGVTMVRGALQRDWKARTTVAPQPQLQAVNVVVPIKSLGEWIAIRERLNNISSLNGIELESLMPTQANIKLTYRGGQERLALTLAQAGMEIERSTANDGSMVNVLRSAQPVQQNQQRYKPMRF